MKSQEENTPYQCDFVLMPRKKKTEGQSDPSEEELSNDCFSLEKKIQK